MSNDAAQPGRSQAWHRLVRMGQPRLTRANAIATILAIGLGFAMSAQVRATSVAGLENLREDELVRVLSDVDADGQRLTDEVARLESSKLLLESRTTSNDEAQRAARQRLDSLGLLAGTVPARGPGIVLTMSAPKNATIDAALMLQIVQELRDAGAEAIQINTVRVVASTWFGDDGSGVVASGVALRSPYTVTAIGDAATLSAAMEIPGGVTSTLRRKGAEASVSIERQAVVDALHTPTPPAYARPDNAS